MPNAIELQLSQTFTPASPLPQALWRPNQNLGTALAAWFAADQSLTFSGTSTTVTGLTSIDGLGTALSNVLNAANTIYNNKGGGTITQVPNAQNGLPMLQNLSSSVANLQTTARMTTTEFVTGAFSVSFVFTPVTGETFPATLLGNGSSQSGAWWIETGSYGAFATTGFALRLLGSGQIAFYPTGYTVTPSKPIIVTITTDGTGTAAGVTITINGVAYTAGSTLGPVTYPLALTAANAGFYLLAAPYAPGANASSGQFLTASKAQLGEVAVVNRVMTATEIAAMQRYLNRRWAIY